MAHAIVPKYRELKVIKNTHFHEAWHRPRTLLCLFTIPLSRLAYYGEMVGEGPFSSIDIRNFLEMGLRIIRFKMGYVTKGDKMQMIEMIKHAEKFFCAKHELPSRPITLAVDIPNASIRTGHFKETLGTEIEIQEDWIVTITSSPDYWNKCDSRNIFIDDPYTIKIVPIDTEIILGFGQVVMIVTEVVDNQSLKCKVVRGGKIKNMEFVCIRGVKHMRPPLSRLDLELIKFAKDFKMDMITITTLRSPQTLINIRKLFPDTCSPLLISVICEQEGLDNLDEILKFSDGIILAREFLASEIKNPEKMITIQLHVTAKCKTLSKPCFISGNVLERTLTTGNISGCDIDDITNGVLQGAGFVMRNYDNPVNVTHAMRHLNEICKTVEPLSTEINDFWRLSEECPVPVTACDASILACALSAKLLDAAVIVVLTVTGTTAKWLSLMAPVALILAVCRNPLVARRLQIHRGVVPIIYDQPPLTNWSDEMEERINFAVNYGIQCEYLTYGSRFVILMKSNPCSAYADSVSSWTVVTEESKKIRTHCPY